MRPAPWRWLYLSCLAGCLGEFQDERVNTSVLGGEHILPSLAPSPSLPLSPRPTNDSPMPTEPPAPFAVPFAVPAPTLSPPAPPLQPPPSTSEAPPVSTTEAPQETTLTSNSAAEEPLEISTVRALSLETEAVGGGAGTGVGAAVGRGARPGGVSAAAVAGGVAGALVLVALGAALAVVLYRRRYLNKPQTLNDKCSDPDSSGYVDDSTVRENSEEMYSLDNDSFLNSLEAMTIQNYWTDSVKHTKL